MGQRGSMNQGTRILNAVILALLTFVGAMQFIEEAAKTFQHRWTHIVGYCIGYFGAYFLLCAPYFLAWRSLGTRGTNIKVRRAWLTNIVASVLMALLVITLLIVFGDKITSFLEVLPFLIITAFLGIPYGLNIRALARQGVRLEQIKVGLEPSVEPVSSDVRESSFTPSPVPPTHQSSSNYFLRHWRGEFSLGISYWLNGNLATLAVFVPIIAAEMMEKGGYTLRTISVVSIGALLFSVAATIWSFVGIWRSANHHVARGGSASWATAARGMVVVGSLVATSQLAVNILPQLNEYALIATGNDPLGNIEIKVAANGQSVIVSGMLREGSAAEVQRILDAAPAANLLVLNSGGGRLMEAQRLGDIVRARTLDTYVEKECASACTYVFLAGKDRAATPRAQIGFHQPHFPGFDDETRKSLTKAMLEVYRAAGLPEPFIQRIAKTSPDDMWYPTRDELIAANVITRISLGGETATGLGLLSKEEFSLSLKTIPLYQALEKRFPGTISKAVETGWAAKQRGGNDDEIASAMRVVIGELVPELLRTADVSTLDSFIALFNKELLAAQDVSQEACARLVAGRLDITNTLPKDLVDQELKLMLRAAESQTTSARRPDPVEIERTLQKAFTGFSPEAIDMATDPASHLDKPAQLCQVAIDFYQTIGALSPRERHIALQGIFQSEEAKPTQVKTTP